MSLQTIRPLIRGIVGNGVNPNLKSTCMLMPVRNMGKHWKPEWRKLRALKVIKVDLPDPSEDQKIKSMTPDEIRAKMKERGFQPMPPWQERQVTITCTGDIVEQYVPPEGDGKASVISTKGVKQSAEMVQKKSKSWLAIRKIRQFDEDFEQDEFVKLAQEIYIKIHDAVANKDRPALELLATETMYSDVTMNMDFKTIHWKYLKTLEPPRIVHVRTADVISKDNVFAQITCRFHSNQMLAVYDRFGRLSHGSEVIAKGVLEYVVFEKHMADQYGTWRIHGKIIPPWAEADREVSPRTFVMSSSPA